MLQPRLSWLVLSLAVARTGALQPPVTQPTGVFLLEKRATCPPSYPVSCGTDTNTWCCESGWVCASDANGDAACCPSGAVCTGSVPQATGISYVENNYYPFPYISTSFSNAGVCSAAYQTCTSNYDICTSGLEGAGAYGVTIAVGGGGGGGTTITEVGATLAPTSAESICSSLSSIACYGGLDKSVCTQTGKVGVFVVSAASRKASVNLLGVVIAAGLGMVGSGFS